jgi:integrase
MPMPAITLDHFRSELLALYEPPLRAPATYRQMRQVLREFAELGTVRKTSDITPTAIAAWLKAFPDRTAVTAASHLRAFRAACSYAKKRGYLRTSPFEIRNDWVDASPLESDQPRRPRHHPMATIARVLQLLDSEAAGGGWEEGRLQALVYTYAFTGLRKSEALYLRKADVDLEARILRVKRRRNFRPKTAASAAPIAIADELGSVLARWLPRTGSDWVFPTKDGKTPWTSGGPGKKPLDMVKAAGRRAGVDGLTILSFRHSFATHSKRWGFGPLELKDWLRHTDIDTQGWYLEDDLENLRLSSRSITFKTVSS